MYYAQINQDRIAFAVTETSGAIESPNMILLQSFDTSVIGKRHDAETGEWEEVPQPEPTPPEWQWHIDIGPFTDRLGVTAFAIEQSADAGVVFIRNDMQRRHWIDLKDPRVAGSLWYLAGLQHPVFGTLAEPLLTSEQVQAVLNTPVADSENRALRRLYFGG